jgi:hypothetical protein
VIAALGVGIGAIGFVVLAIDGATVVIKRPMGIKYCFMLLSLS